MISLRRDGWPTTLVKGGMLFWAFNVFIAQLNPISLYIIIPLSFIYCLLHYNIRNKNRYFRLYMFVVIWITLTLLTTHYMDASIKQMKFFSGCIMLCYICCCLAEDYKNYMCLYFMWLMFFGGVIAYTFISGMMSNIDINKTRFNDGELNANTIAYATFYFTFALYMLGELARRKKYYRLLFFITIPLSMFVSLVTASRQVLIIQIPLIFLLIAIRHATVLKYAKTFVIGMCVCVAVGNYTIEKVSNIYQDSLLVRRSKRDVKDGSRAKLIQDAINVGMEHPLVGVGPGNYVRFSYNKHFSHCTYTELFANHGVPGILLWLLMLFVFFRNQVNYYWKTKDKIFLGFIAFGVVFCIDNFFYVFYNCIFLMPLFLIVGTHSDKYYLMTIENDTYKK